jgi:exodeoxyribonuclease V alpha subunit
MKITNNVHQQFAEYFPSESARPYLYLLSKRLSEGHICIDVENIEEDDFDNLYSVPRKSIQDNSMVSSGEKKKPLILNKNLLYLQRYFNYETIILNWIQQSAQTEEEQFQTNSEQLKTNRDFITNLFQNQQSTESNNSTNWQLVAALSAVLNNFTIITGGPGTGKTTTVAKILSILFQINPDLKVALAAPTGKAASRMDESLKIAAEKENEIIQTKFQTLQPFTIHRLLGWQKNSIYFKHNSDNTLNYDVVIVDEASMIDVALFAKLLSAIGAKTKLIVLGDKNQLTSVEAGSLFGDLCQAQISLNIFSEERVTLINSFIENKSQQIPNTTISTSQHPLFQHVIELQKSYRFSDGKGIGKFSKAVIKNDEESIKEFFKNTDEQILIDTKYSASIFQKFIDAYKEYIEEKDLSKAFKKLNQLKVLVAVREGEQGLYAINKEIERYLIERKYIKYDQEFYENRPVMVTSNNYELNLFNGDIGIIRRDENGIIKIWFENNGQIQGISPFLISKVETVFAMTVHKSQGSEFNKILIVLPKNENIKILTRELLYTAISRAKERVIIQGSEATILQTSKEIVKRGSGIIARFNQ